MYCCVKRSNASVDSSVEEWKFVVGFELDGELDVRMLFVEEV